ncbi:MAG: four helix bundle protein [Verrucomicrobiota bacterium]
MSIYLRFEDLPVWCEGIRLAEGIYDLTEAVGKRLSYSAKDQIERAALSVSNNIAEGFERGTTNELLAFLYIARGLAGEVRSMLCFFERRKVLCDLRSEISNLKSIAESCSRQLRAWADSLQNSEIKGQRHLNDSSRREFDRKRNSDEGIASFRQRLVDTLPPNHPALANLKSQI